jgi:hypothetical protein
MLKTEQKNYNIYCIKRGWYEMVLECAVGYKERVNICIIGTRLNIECTVFTSN